MNQQEWNTTVDKLALDDLQKLGRGRTESERHYVQTCYRISFSAQPEKERAGTLKMTPNTRWWVACVGPLAAVQNAQTKK